MPGRKTILATNEIYHVYNRGINRQPIFIYKSDYERATESLNYYKYSLIPIKLSMFLKKEQKDKNEILKTFEERGRAVDILSYCLMPNHYHILVKQLEDGGISKYVGNIQNSYTKYFNARHERDGSLFLDQFKAVRIETDEQLIHVSRYIHLNPFTSAVINKVKDLTTYNWSSLKEYQIIYSQGICNKSLIFGYFSNNVKEYNNFIFDQANYQKVLHQIKHLAFD